MFQQLDIMQLEEAKIRITASITSKRDTLKEALEFGDGLKKTLKDHQIMFESGNGKEMKGIPFQIFQIMKGDRRFDQFTFIWCITSKKKFDKYNRKYAKDKNVLIHFGRDAVYRDMLACSKFVISENRLPYYYVRRDGQKYLNTGNEEYYERETWEDNNEKISLKRQIIKDLLNTSHLLSISPEMTKLFYKKKNQLDTLYSGEILELSRLDQGNLKLVISYFIFDNKEQNINILSLQTNKKKILINAKYNKSEWWQRRIARMVNNIDYSRFDVTLLTKVVRGDKGLKALESLNKNVRILMRSGYMDMSEKEFESYYYIDKCFLDLSNPKEYFNKISKETIKNEWKRLMGTDQFDVAILCDNELKDHMGFWQMMYSEAQIDKKYFMNWEDLCSQTEHLDDLINTEDSRLARFICNLDMFDKVLFLSEEEKLRNQKLFEIFGNDKLGFIGDTLPKDFKKEVNLRTCYFAGEEFAVLHEEGNELLKTIAICSIPKDGLFNLVANINSFSDERVRYLLNKFKEIKGQKTDARLYIFDGLCYMKDKYTQLIKDLGVENDVHIIENQEMTLFYLKKCQAFLKIDAKDIYLKEAEKLEIPIL